MPSKPTGSVTDPHGGDFEALLRQHARVVSAAIRRVCGRAWGALAPDVEQEVHLALWKIVGSGKKLERPASYLYKVALRTALTMIRRHEPEAPLDDAQLESIQGQHDAAGAALAADRARRLETGLGHLPAEQARALRAYLRGFNHNEVAELYGWTESMARHRIYRGAEALRKILNEGES